MCSPHLLRRLKRPRTNDWRSCSRCKHPVASFWPRSGCPLAALQGSFAFRVRSLCRETPPPCEQVSRSRLLKDPIRLTNPAGHWGPSWTQTPEKLEDTSKTLDISNKDTEDCPPCGNKKVKGISQPRSRLFGKRDFRKVCSGKARSKDPPPTQNPWLRVLRMGSLLLTMLAENKAAEGRS